MNEFKSFQRYEDYVKELIAEELNKAGAVEVYQTGTWQNLGNYHTDSVGDYVGEFLNCIPEGAEIRYTVMDSEEYGSTLLANCGGDPEDYICEETGKVLIVQFYVPISEEE